jgi:cation transport regulator ChaB
LGRAIVSGSNAISYLSESRATQVASAHLPVVYEWPLKDADDRREQAMQSCLYRVAWQKMKIDATQGRAGALAQPGGSIEQEHLA